MINQKLKKKFIFFLDFLLIRIIVIIEVTPTRAIKLNPGIPGGIGPGDILFVIVIELWPTFPASLNNSFFKEERIG